MCQCSILCQCSLPVFFGMVPRVLEFLVNPCTFMISLAPLHGQGTKECCGGGGGIECMCIDMMELVFACWCQTTMDP